MYYRYVGYTCTFFQWLETEFIAYLDEWEASANGREELTAAERQKLCISCETFEGLRFTGIHNYNYIYMDCIHIALHFTDSYCACMHAMVDNPLFNMKA